ESIGACSRPVTPPTPFVTADGSAADFRPNPAAGRSGDPTHDRGGVVDGPSAGSWTAAALGTRPRAANAQGEGPPRVQGEPGSRLVVSDKYAPAMARWSRVRLPPEPTRRGASTIGRAGQGPPDALRVWVRPPFL